MRDELGAVHLRAPVAMARVHHPDRMLGDHIDGRVAGAHPLANAGAGEKVFTNCTIADAHPATRLNGIAR